MPSDDAEFAIKQTFDAQRIRLDFVSNANQNLTVCWTSPARLTQSGLDALYMKIAFGVL